jgi:hypothetical protein
VGTPQSNRLRLPSTQTNSVYGAWPRCSRTRPFHGWLKVSGRRS